MTLWPYLRHPRAGLRRFDADAPTLATLPYGAWGALAGIAVAGSGLYSASLALVLPAWRPTRGALWLALSAGSGWLVFGPTLVLVSRRNPFSLAHACLVTMAYGEAVLGAGATINALLALTALPRRVAPGPFNLAWVGLSNVVMATALTMQLRVIGVPARRTLLLWVIGLDGSGALFFALFRRLLRDRSS